MHIGVTKLHTSFHHTNFLQDEIQTKIKVCGPHKVLIGYLKAIFVWWKPLVL